MYLILVNFCSQKRTLIILTTLILKNTIWVSKSFILTKEVTQCLHEILLGVCDLSIENASSNCFSEISNEYKFRSLSKESGCSHENNLKGFARETFAILS